MSKEDKKHAERLSRDADSLILYRRGGHVKRHHTQLTTKPQNNAEHSYGVACLVDFITECTARPALLRSALYHDVSEAITGDIPQPFKVMCPSIDKALGLVEAEFERKNRVNRFIQDLTDEEKTILKVADLVDYLFFCYEELMLGNSFYQESLARVVPLVKYVADGLPEGEVRARCIYLSNLVVKLTERSVGYYG